MLKRVFLFLLALTLLIAPAHASTPGSDALYLLVDRTDKGDIPVGTAVLFKDQTSLLTTMWAILHTGELYAKGAGGEFAITRVKQPSAQSELVLLLLDAPSPATPLPLSTHEGDLSVMGYQGDQVVCGPISYPSIGHYNGLAAALYTAPASLLPGSVLINDSGELAGLTMATYLDGVNRYVALTGQELLGMLSGTPAPSEGVTWLEGFTATPGPGCITVDWASALPACDEEDCVITLFFADDANPYFSYLTPDSEGSCQLAVAPGRDYTLWVQHAHGETNITAARSQNQAVKVSVPAAEPFALYDYQDSAFYLGAFPAIPTDDMHIIHVVPLEAITAQALTAPDNTIYMQAVSTYTVEETCTADLLVVLTTPEGFTFEHLGQFIFDVTLQTNDVWNVDISPLLDDYLAYNEDGVMQPGEYALRYYLDGALANELLWTLE